MADPSPGLGWRGRARSPLEARGAPELILALGVVHDLVLRRDIPLSDLVAWFAELGADLVIEFVGRDDPDVERLLRARTSSPSDYSAEALELALARHFDQVTHEAIGSGGRTLYHAAGAVRRT